jgi:hypothetical protein
MTSGTSEYLRTLHVYFNLEQLLGNVIHYSAFTVLHFWPNKSASSTQSAFASCFVFIALKSDRLCRSLVAPPSFVRQVTETDT